MNIAIMQPYFLPYLGYFQLIDAADLFIAYPYVDFNRRGWINRNRFLIIHGQPRFFNIPVHNYCSKPKISDLKIDYSKNWRRKLFEDIRFNYKRCPFFDEIFPVFSEILTPDFEYLVDLNISSISKVCRILGVTTQIISSRPYFGEIENEVLIIKDKTERMQRRITSICRHENSDLYINAIGGKCLYPKELFTEEHIDIRFVQSDLHEYKQNSDVFYPNLSILDVLMNLGVEKTKIELKSYELSS
ncbi:MAG: WbqC family protein [Ignavibacteriales bacterium]|nr:WbqC family protein [Ignavibacteriales bacterium]MCF8315040.1 WbqC family protein [Ignavibacteriales bacterium]MCF8435964.1 WbqC family protein [Ignavibacteriales bacterium]